jgi:cobalt-zinc-cadmium efflux system membrane fusion protein
MSEPKTTLAARIPAISVLVLLALIALWGHRSGWKAGKFSELFGRGAGEEKEDWCDAHGVAKSRCIACNPALGGADAKDWCKEHGVPESKCSTCHPEILTQGKASDWCKEHGVPELSCTICHPDIAVKGSVPKSPDAPTISQSQDPKSAPDPSHCQTHHLRVQFASAAALKKVGIQLAAVEDRPMVASVPASAEMEYDPSRLAQLSPRAAGVLWRVDKQIGEAVKKGEVLALVDAAEAGRAKSELLQALAQVDVRSKSLKRIQASADQGFRTQAELQEAEAGLREARIKVLGSQQALANLGLPLRSEDFAGLSEEQSAEKLRFLGLPEETRKSLDPAALTSNLLPLVAPFDGVVISREGVAGEKADPSKPIFGIADVRRLWILLDVRLEDASALAIGQAVHFRPDGSSDEAVVGKVLWLSTAVDEKTRTVKVRAEVDNPEGRLRAHTFGSARIVTRRDEKAVAVPDEALQWEGCCHIVFVRVADEIFQTRKVRLGARNRGYSEILVGLLPGEVVVTTGSHVLKSDILKSKLGAGCVD